MTTTNKITFDAVKSAVESNKETITDRGDMVRKVAEMLATKYGNVYLKVVKAEKELGLTLSSRKGRRPGAKTTLVTVVKSKDGSVVAEGLKPADAEALIAKFKAQKKGALCIAA